MLDLSNDLKFKVETLGVIRSGEFVQKPLTIFCGPNNSTKTWTMYSLYRCHHTLLRWAQALSEKKEKENVVAERPPSPKAVSLQKFNDYVSAALPGLFNAPEELLQGARFNIDIDTGAFQELLSSLKGKPPFLMPAERNGLHLFYHELSTRRTALLHHASKKDIDVHELLKDVMRSRYAVPIARYIDWLNDLPEQQKHSSNDFHGYAAALQKELAAGAYKIDRRTGQIEFKPYKIQRGQGPAARSMGLHLTSSTVKSLFGLWFYLEH